MVISITKPCCWRSSGTKPKLLIVDEPTRGVDVGAKSEVHRTLSQLAKEGMAIIMISSDLPEVIGMADRVLVMHEGKLTAELSRSEANEEAIMFAATGRTASNTGTLTSNYDRGS